jgi:hypothetical protein
MMLVTWGAGVEPLGSEPNDDYFIIGHNFMERYYTIFDYE